MPPKERPDVSNEVLAHAHAVANLYLGGADVQGPARELAKIIAAAYVAVYRHGDMSALAAEADKTLAADERRTGQLVQSELHAAVARTLDGPRPELVRRVVSVLSAHGSAVRKSVQAGKWPGAPDWPASDDAPVTARVAEIVTDAIDEDEYRGDDPVETRASHVTTRLVRRLGIGGRPERRKLGRKV